MSIRSYRDLQVWQKAMELVEQCYQATRLFPSEERFGLTNQIRRAAVSIPSNIAEGHGRAHTKEFLNHLSMVRGSINELETQLEISHRVGFMSEESLKPLLALCDEIGRMTTVLRQKLESRVLPPTP
jgi:four helix bundle protein